MKTTLNDSERYLVRTEFDNQNNEAEFPRFSNLDFTKANKANRY